MANIKYEERRILKPIAEKHQLPTFLLEDLIKTAHNFEYENLTAGKRQTEYLNSIIYAINKTK